MWDKLPTESFVGVSDKRGDLNYFHPNTHTNGYGVHLWYDFCWNLIITTLWVISIIFRASTQKPTLCSHEDGKRWWHILQSVWLIVPKENCLWFWSHLRKPAVTTRRLVRGWQNFRFGISLHTWFAERRSIKPKWKFLCSFGRGWFPRDNRWPADYPSWNRKNMQSLTVVWHTLVRSYDLCSQTLDSECTTGLKQARNTLNKHALRILGIWLCIASDM